LFSLKSYISHIFISFKTEERDIAFFIKNELEKHKFSVWWHEDIQCGRKWHNDIDEALSQAGCVIVLWSHSSINSAWVRHEASQAIVKGTYTPVLIDTIDIFSPYNNIQNCDLTAWLLNKDASNSELAKLITRIRLLTNKNIWKKINDALTIPRITLTFILFLILIGIKLDNITTKQELIENMQRQTEYLYINSIDLTAELYKNTLCTNTYTNYFKNLSTQLQISLNKKHYKSINGFLQKNSSIAVGVRGNIETIIIYEPFSYFKNIKLLPCNFQKTYEAELLFYKKSNLNIYQTSHHTLIAGRADLSISTKPRVVALNYSPTLKKISILLKATIDEKEMRKNNRFTIKSQTDLSDSFVSVLFRSDFTPTSITINHNYGSHSAILDIQKNSMQSKIGKLHKSAE
jgi:hypothetical protein